MIRRRMPQAIPRPGPRAGTSCKSPAIRSGPTPHMVALLLSLCATTAAADPPSLAPPIDCTLGETCHIQNYVDRDRGPGHADFACGPLSYDSHKGTDFALPSLAAMQAGVDVLAAAAGTVLGRRDGMEDAYFTPENEAALDGRDCGNGVLIDHGGGWHTQYCHMKSGSIAVAEGDSVASGDVLGQVGLSGRTAFPHLHVSVQKDGETIDPFQPAGSTVCGDAENALWSQPVPYVPGGMIAAGFAPAVPEFDAIKAGTAASGTLSDTAGALVFWVYLYGGHDGDRIAFEIDGPRGTFLEQEVGLTRTQAQLFRAVGRKRTKPFWTDGSYTGTATLIRDGVEIDRITASLTVTR